MDNRVAKVECHRSHSLTASICRERRHLSLVNALTMSCLRITSVCSDLSRLFRHALYKVGDTIAIRASKTIITFLVLSEGNGLWREIGIRD